jgi:hypothetical protein
MQNQTQHTAGMHKPLYHTRYEVVLRYIPQNPTDAQRLFTTGAFRMRTTRHTIMEVARQFCDEILAITGEDVKMSWSKYADKQALLLASTCGRGEWQLCFYRTALDHDNGVKFTHVKAAIAKAEGR